MQVSNDAQLRDLARRRVGFRAHVVAFCITMSALWLVWYVTGQGYMWPVWPTAGWGIGLIFHYLFDYRNSGFLSEEKEYERLRKDLNEHQRLAH